MLRISPLVRHHMVETHAELRPTGAKVALAAVMAAVTANLDANPHRRLSTPRPSQRNAVEVLARRALTQAREGRLTRCI